MGGTRGTLFAAGMPGLSNPFAQDDRNGEKWFNPRWPWPPTWPPREKLPDGPFGGGRAKPGSYFAWLHKLWEQWGKPPPPRRWRPPPGGGRTYLADATEDSLLSIRQILMDIMLNTLIFLGPSRYPIIAVGGGGGRTTSGWDYFNILAEAKDLIDHIDLMLSRDTAPTVDETLDVAQGCDRVQNDAASAGIG